MTAYLFGAGASFHAGFPLAVNLGNELGTWICGAQIATYDYKTPVQKMHELYGGLQNIEEILTDFDDPSPSSPASRLDSASRRDLLDKFLVALREFFDHRSTGWAKLYGRFACERVQPGDALITFNYDVELERELKKAGLWEISDGYGFPVELPSIPPSGVSVLKLHGSINWFALIMGGIQGAFSPSSLFGDGPVILRERDFQYLGYPPGLQDPRCTVVTVRHAAPGMILPIHHKRFYWKTFFSDHEWEQFWERLWQKAKCALQSSKHIVMIGYSMARVDERARKLLFESANQTARITLCCGEKTDAIRDEFLGHGFNNIETPKGGKFEDFLDLKTPLPLVPRS
jgi:hypothetical protein